MAGPDSAGASPLAASVCTVHPGNGLVARWHDLFLVVAVADASASAVVDVCRSVAQSGGDGRALSRRLAGWLATAEGELPAFAAMAPAATGLAVFVQGAAEVIIGEDFKLSGGSSLAWVDRLLPWPVTALTLRTASMGEPVATPLDFEGGVVPGGGMTLSSAPADAADGTDKSEPSAAEGRAPEQTVGSSDSSPLRQVPEPPPASDRWPGKQRERQPAFESVLLTADASADPQEPPRKPLPIAGKPSRRRSSGGQVVRGIYCKNQHFNDGRMLFCAVCGINMVQQTPVIVEGPRPPLGVLLLDDGSVFSLDADYVLGREPEHDKDVRAGRLRGITLKDTDKTVSRAHARIELRGWDVVVIDKDSANGTYVAAEHDTHWTPLQPGAPYTLGTGCRLQLGSHTLVYNSHRGV